MKVLCPNCDKPSQIRTTKKITRKVVDRYHQCTDIACGCSFKSQTAIIYIIQPPLDHSRLKSSDRKTLTSQNKHINQKPLTKTPEGEVEPFSSTV